MARTQSATLVFGAKISNQEGTKVGQIQDLIVDLKSGQVIYAIISLDDEMGIDDKYFPIPVKALKENPEREEIVLDIEESQLETAPSYTKQEWPREYDEEFINSVYSHYGYHLPER